MFATVLRLLALACFAPALIHAALGVGGDWVLGIGVPTPVDPSLDSQNRFYGVAFALYGAVLWLSASDVARYAPVLRAALALMFAGGCARGLAVLAHGWPSWPVVALAASELVVPPLVWIWLGQQRTT